MRLDGNGMSMDMGRKGIILAGVFVVYLMTACAESPDSEERGGIRVAVGESADRESRREEDAVGRPADGAKDSGDGSASGEFPGDGNAAAEGGFPESETAENGTPEHAFEREALEILEECADARMQQTIETGSGTLLSIDAQVKTEGITGVSRYEYVLTDITEEIRRALFRAVFPETADQAEYDERNDVWTLDVDSAIRNYFLYQISYTNGGATIPGEQIIVLENRYYDLYPFEDNRLASVSHSGIEIAVEETEDRCRQVVDSLADTGDYGTDFVHAYGTRGRRPYLKLVFKRMLDGMPVTAYNDLAFLFDNEGIERVCGSLFSVEELGLDRKLLSPGEAVGKLQDQAAFLNLEGADQVVSQIALEYVVVTSPEGQILVTPVWRFLLGKEEEERNFLRQKILGIDALTGELIWEERGHTL